MPGCGRCLCLPRHTGTRFCDLRNLEFIPIEEVLENFHVTRDQVQATLDFAAKSALSPLEPSRAA